MIFTWIEGIRQTLPGEIPPQREKTFPNAVPHCPLGKNVMSLRSRSKPQIGDLTPKTWLELKENLQTTYKTRPFTVKNTLGLFSLVQRSYCITFYDMIGSPICQYRIDCSAKMLMR